MEERDFEWCFEHEILFRDWWSYINEYDLDIDLSFDNDSFFLCWKKAKEYALEIANSVDPQSRYNLTVRDIFFNTHDYKHWLLSFTNAMIMSIKNENLEEFVSKMKKHTFESLSKFVFNENSSDIKSPEFQLFYCIERFEKKPDYDYSLPDGGIKDKTETDETITKTETKTKTITDGSVTLPAVLDTNEFKKYLSLAKEKGLIKNVDGKLEWIQIGDRSGSSQLAYFLGRVFGYKHSVNGNIGNEFPGDELDELFGVKRIYRLLVQVHSASKPQKWRRKIDELFE